MHNRTAHLIAIVIASAPGHDHTCVTHHLHTAQAQRCVVTELQVQHVAAMTGSWVTRLNFQ
jgi:alkylhydroperoxidase/carboxymuconolactone decarboxylase family protein YurZ